jgi:2-oxoglutarate dehydrogenase complex dehydrogenase (E1) component-like enzyme
MITQTATTSFKADLLKAVHDFNTDTFKLALYLATADLGANTTVYTTSGETSGTGYVAGGNTLTGVSVNDAGFVLFSNTSWNPAVFTARGALIYNSSKSNKAVAVLDFGSDKTATNTFLVQMPANTATSALIRFS